GWDGHRIAARDMRAQHAEQPAVDVDQRATRQAWQECDVSPDVGVEQAALRGAPCAAERADRAEAGDRFGRPRAADGKRQLAWLGGARLGTLDLREGCRWEAQDSEITGWVAADEAGLVLAAVGRGDGEVGVAFEHVRGGDDLVVAPGKPAGGEAAAA